MGKKRNRSKEGETRLSPVVTNRLKTMCLGRDCDYQTEMRRLQEIAYRLGVTKALPPNVSTFRTPSTSKLFSSGRTPFTAKLTPEFEPKPGVTLNGADTPGSSVTSCVNTRLVSGNVFTCSPVTVLPSLAVVVFTTGGASETVTVSVRAPTASTESTRTCSEACTANAA